MRPARINTTRVYSTGPNSDGEPTLIKPKRTRLKWPARPGIPAGPVVVRQITKAELRRFRQTGRTFK